MDPKKKQQYEDEYHGALDKWKQEKTIYEEKYGKADKKKADKEKTLNSKPDKEMGAKKEDKRRGRD